MAQKGVNKVILIGNLGADPEIRYMPGGDAVANITIATSESWIDKQSQEKREQTEWHRLTIYRRLAEVAGEYLRKGSKIYVEGKLRTRKWQDAQGIDRYTTEIIVDEMQMLDGRPSDGGGNQNNNNNNNQNNNQPRGQARNNNNNNNNRSNNNNNNSNQGPQGGFNQNAPQGGFNQNAPQGGFNQNDPQGGFNQPPANSGRGPGEPPIDFDDDIPF